MVAISPEQRREEPPSAEAPPAAPAEVPYPPLLYAWYVVGVLMVVYIFSFADRQLMNLLVDDLKQGLSLEHDWQVSILMGPMFAVFYAIFGFPLGWLADVMSRRTLIAAGLAAWSLMAAGCGVAKNYFQMALYRIGVGVGEASLSPAAYSLITDYFRRERLATAISVYGTGIYIGSGLALIVGGVAVALVKEGPDWTLPLVGTIPAWQKVFIIVGLPGLLVVPLLYTFAEPVRRALVSGRGAAARQVPVGEVLRYFRANGRTILCHNFGFSLLSFSAYGSSAWIPAFFIREYGWTQRQAGIWYGTIIAVSGTLGIAAGGYLADWLAKRGYTDSKMRSGFIASWIWAPFGMFYPLVPTAELAIVFLIPSVFMASMPFGVAPAAIQEMMPVRMRGQASALYLFVVNIVGLAIGPTAVALATDYIFRDGLGLERPLRYSLFSVATTAHLLAAILLYLGLPSFKRSMDYLTVWQDAQAPKPSTARTVS